MSSEQQVLAAAARLVDVFGNGDLDAYFAAFAPAASFLFYTHPTRLMSRADYRLCWQDWQRELGFRVLSCESSNQAVRMLGDSGLFLHDVTTQIRTHEGDSTVHERESILFRAAADGRWLAWHEHLSPAPLA